MTKGRPAGVAAPLRRHTSFPDRRRSPPLRLKQSRPFAAAVGNDTVGTQHPPPEGDRDLDAGGVDQASLPSLVDRRNACHPRRPPRPVSARRRESRPGAKAPAMPKLTSAVTPARRNSDSARSVPAADRRRRQRKRSCRSRRAIVASAARPVTAPIFITCRKVGRPGVPAPQVAIARQRPEREKGAVAVIAQIEHAGEAHRRIGFLVPEPVRLLRLHEEADAARHRGMIDFAGRHQPEQRPGGLRRACSRRLRHAAAPGQ